MTDPRDRVDSWLDAEVEPLAPRPGAYEQVRTRALRRKVIRAVISAAGAVVIITGLAALQRVVPSLLSPKSTSAAGTVGSQSPAATPHSATPSVAATTTPSPSVAATTPQASTLANPTTTPPINFQPTSVTFVGSNTGAVIGQAGHPGHCAPANPDICTSMAATLNYGITWHGMNPPDTPGPTGSVGVSQLRFLNQDQGWAFGPALFATQNSGAAWIPESTSGRVTDLETVDGRVFAVEATGCTGTGAHFASGCTSVSLYAADAGGGVWQPVPGAANLPVVGNSDSASLVLVRSTTGHPADDIGYLLGPDGRVLRGHLNAGAVWKHARHGRLPAR